MQTLGLADSTPKSEGRLRALLWPTINSEVAAATAAHNAMYATFAIAALSILIVLIQRVNASAFAEIVLFVILGFGIRQFSVTASILALILFIGNLIASLSRGQGVLGVIIADLLLGGVRAAWFMRREKMTLAPAWRRTRPVIFAVSTILFGLFIAQTFVLRALVLPTGSMEPTLLIGDRFFALRPAFMGTIRRGDIIAFKAPFDATTSLIKRVIGVPGDRIHFEHSRLFLNGLPVDESYVSHDNRFPDDFRDNFPIGPPPSGLLYESGTRMLQEDVHDGELVVPRGGYFVLGDNRSNSLDSRYWGFVPYANVLGRPVFIYDSRGSEGRRAARSGT
jgi:signal peptidase I